MNSPTAASAVVARLSTVTWSACEAALQLRTPPGAGDPTPALRMQVGVECSPACTGASPIVLQTTSTSWTANSPISFDVEFATPPDTAREFSVTLRLYAGHENVSEGDVRNRANVDRPVSLTLPKLRCDVNLAYGGTEGCVYSEAAPVFALQTSDNVPESRLQGDRPSNRARSIPGRW